MARLHSGNGPPASVSLVAPGRGTRGAGTQAWPGLALAEAEVRLRPHGPAPLKVLCELGGWKEAHTVLKCYQRADETQLREALASRPRVRP